MVLPAFIGKLSAAEMADRHARGCLNGVFRISNEDYHAGPGLSSSGVKKLLDSPAHFKIPTPKTDAMAFGTALHMAILEAPAFDLRVTVFDGASRQSKAWETFEAKALSEGKVPVITKEMVIIDGLRNSFSKSATWASLSRGAEHELAAFVQTEGEAARKAMADCISSDGIITDIKTTSCTDLDGFVRSIYDFGYHISGAYYLDTWSAALAVKLNTFVLVAAEKAPPYGLRFVPLSERMIEIGREECQRAQAIYETCIDSDSWECYPDRFEEVEFPPYILARYNR